MYLVEQVCKKDICNYDLMGYAEELINVIALKSPNTASHCIRVSIIALEIGKTFNLSTDEMEQLFVASMLHDVGKVLVDDKILNKPNKLTEVEYEVIKKHSKMGFHILNKIKGFENVSEIVLHHHERYDGEGYPNGLKGKRIPFLSRIIAVADSFDAMTYDRPYRKKMRVEEAVKEIEKNKYSQFDKDIASAFLYLVKNNNMIIP